MPLRRMLAPGFVAVAIVAGCSSGAPQAEPPVVEVSVEDLRTFAFPLDPYLNLGGPSSEADSTAYRTVFGRCMSRFGFTVDPPPSDLPSPIDFRVRLFGLADMDNARRYGYNNPLTLAQDSPDVGSTEPRTAAYWAVAAGEEAEYQTHNGLPIPEGGCSGEAERTLNEGAPPVDDPMFGQALWNQANGRADQDSRVVAVFEAWSDCMSRSGYDYADPSEPNNDPAFDGPEVTQEEIALATTDVACKEEVDMIDIRTAVTVAYQKLVIEEHAEALAELQETLDVRRRNAAEVLEREG